MEKNEEGKKNIQKHLERIYQQRPKPTLGRPSHQYMIIRKSWPGQ